MPKTSCYTNRKRHAQRRAMQRHGITLRGNDYRHLANLIQTGNAVHIEKLSWTKSKYQLTFEGKLLTVIYSNSTKQVVTILP